MLIATPEVRSSCDLDLLVFLFRHPRSLLTSEQLAAFAGYPLGEIAQSLDKFIAAQMLDRIQNEMHAARMYLLNLDGPQGESLKALLRLASTNQGRREVLQTLKSGSPPDGGAKAATRGSRLLRIA